MAACCIKVYNKYDNDYAQLLAYLFCNNWNHLSFIKCKNDFQSDSFKEMTVSTRQLHNGLINLRLYRKAIQITQVNINTYLPSHTRVIQLQPKSGCKIILGLWPQRGHYSCYTLENKDSVLSFGERWINVAHFIQSLPFMAKNHHFFF